MYCNTILTGLCCQQTGPTGLSGSSYTGSDGKSVTGATGADGKSFTGMTGADGKSYTGPTGPPSMQLGAAYNNISQLNQMISQISTSYLINPGTLPTWTTSSGASVSIVVGTSNTQQQQVSFTNSTGQLSLNVPNPNAYIADYGSSWFEF
jgi:hypothetical protein